MSDAALLPVATAADTRAELRDLLAHQWWRVAGIAVLLAGAAAAGLVVPATLGAIVDAAIAGDPPAELWRLGGVMVAAALVGALLTGLGVVASAQVFDSTLAGLRERLVERALALPQGRVEAAGSGDLISRAGDDVAEVDEAITKVLPAFASAGFTIVLTALGLAALDVRYLLAMLLVIPVHVLAARSYLRRAPAVYAAERAAMARRAHELLGSIRGLPTVHAYRLGAARISKIAAASWDVVRWSMRARIVQNVLFGRLNLAEYVGMTALLITGFLLVRSGSGTVGATTTAVLFFLALFGPIGRLLFVIDDLQSAAASLTRIVGVIRCDRPETAPLPAVSVSDPGKQPEGSGVPVSANVAMLPEGPGVEVDAVTFGYHPHRPVVHRISLTIPAGQQVALVGASGAGKSTLAWLIAGVVRPTTGRVRITGQDLACLPDDVRARRVALITQEVHTFAGTLREDLTLARPDATDADLARALDRVGAASFVGRLPDGLDTIVGAHGARFTPAQAQQLALARLVLADPPVAVLDEATAESGSSGARVLETASAAALRGRTAMIVAHRLSQAAIADRILVMEDGRIVQDGRHQDLVDKPGRYAELWAAWSAHRPG